MTIFYPPSQSSRWQELRRVAIALALVSGGCSGGGGDQPELGRVHGTVTLDGKPLAGAQITFEPQSGGRFSTGVTAADGSFDLVYIRSTKGAKVDRHTVRITTYQPAGADENDQLHPEVPERVPSAYNEQSNLTVEVKPGDNDFSFDVNSENPSSSE